MVPLENRTNGMKKLVFLLCAGLLLMACKHVNEQPMAEFSSETMEQGAMLVDVRTPEEFGAGHLEGAVNIDWFDPDFAAHWDGVDRDRPVYVYCKLGGRSAKAAAVLDSLGFKRVMNLSGGYDAYLQATE